MRAYTVGRGCRFHRENGYVSAYGAAFLRLVIELSVPVLEKESHMLCTAVAYGQVLGRRVEKRKVGA